LAAIYIVRDPRNLITSLGYHYELSLDEAFSFLTNKKKIIFSTNVEITYNLEPPEIFDRLELVNFYIISNYELHKKFDGYEIFKKQ